MKIRELLKKENLKEALSLFLNILYGKNKNISVGRSSSISFVEFQIENIQNILAFSFEENLLQSNIISIKFDKFSFKGINKTENSKIILNEENKIYFILTMIPYFLTFEKFKVIFEDIKEKNKVEENNLEQIIGLLPEMIDTQKSINEKAELFINTEIFDNKNLFKIIENWGKGFTIIDITKDNFENKKDNSFEKALEDFILSNENIERKNLIPNIENLVNSKEVDKITKAVVKQGFRNFCISGPAGTGKSTIAKIIAGKLKLPFSIFSCSAGTEEMDLLINILPNNNENKLNKNVDLDLLYFEPELAYQELTGKKWEKKERPTLNDFLELKEQSSYKYINSTIVETFKNGGVIEIQEPNTVSQSGVLVKLNSMLEEGILVTPYGEVIKRHPKCVVIITKNDNYQGTRSLNESFLDRFEMVLIKEDFTEQEILNRIKNNLEEKNIIEYDIAFIKEAIKVYRNIKEFLKENLYEGNVSYRSLFSWILTSIVTDEVQESFEDCFLYKISEDKEIIEEIKSLFLAFDF